MTAPAPALGAAGLIEALRPVPLLPVLRLSSAEEAVALSARLVGAGLRVLELTATTPGWDEAVRAVRAEHPDAVVGVGTVTTAADAERALAAGARFLVSPWPAPHVRPVAAAAGAAFLEGGCTPAEVADAVSRGPAKVFPAHLGGPAYVRSLLAVLPGAHLVPTGGVRLEDVPQWLAAGAVAVGIGSDLTAPGDVGERVRELLARTRGAGDGRA
ncbi:bifunctional 4-hydroxy-2-oxoglutarate aldolase/2-dehydro-3-deoxy-phosphogluconate aldolase [Kineococcus gypseus]|uniref:bifunctional 4-hydroxy-2-oxoglutarate aldolase/2-dehydro-3-deoxy-phosphogluconate aldolase n=1 Tax=Kineococcus gypseus TaxID=1637102 RepID=UPI003D7D88C4